MNLREQLEARLAQVEEERRRRHIRLERALLCVNCEALFEGGTTCPACGGAQLFPVARALEAKRGGNDENYPPTCPPRSARLAHDLPRAVSRIGVWRRGSHRLPARPPANRSRGHGSGSPWRSSDATASGRMTSETIPAFEVRELALACVAAYGALAWVVGG